MTTPSFTLPDPVFHTTVTIIEDFFITPTGPKQWNTWGTKRYTSVGTKRYTSVGAARGALSSNLAWMLHDPVTRKTRCWTYTTRNKCQWVAVGRSLCQFGNEPVSHYVVRISTYDNGIVTINDLLTFEVVPSLP